MSTKEQKELKEQAAFTARVLSSLTNDIVLLREATERVAIQIRALAMEYKVAA